MATVEKLQLCGLRSFGPYEDDMQTVRFSSPLTLFLGENGCGKTTIIEALKFACSGEVPGGSKSGQGFVNDPKLSNKASSRGQVRLRIVDARGNKFLIIKSVQVINKGVTSSFKRLDTLLKKINADGSETTISSRCADIDTDICEILGVSKAILNNVIFCHQENAAWPLDEAKKLKEKFDEIFGATEYNKCADNIRKMIKEKDTANKILFARVGMLKQTKDIVDKKRSDLNAKEEKSRDNQERKGEKEKLLEPIIKRLREISDLETNLAELQSVCTKKETIKASIIDQQNSILKNLLKEYEGSDEDLQNEIDSFKTNYGKIEQNLKNLKQKEKNVEAEQNQLSISINRAQIKFGKLQELKHQHQNTVTERNEQIQAASNTFKIQIASDLSTNDDVLGAIDILKKSVENSKVSLEDLKKNCDAEESVLQKTVDECRDKLTKTNRDIELRNDTIRDKKKKHRDIQSQLRELDYSDQQLASLKSRINRIDTDLENLKTSFDVDAVTKSIESDKQKLREQDEKLEVLEKERKILQQNCVTEAEIETQKHEVVKHEAEIHKLKNKHFESLNKIFGEDNVPNPGFIHKAVESCKQSNTNKINEINKNISVKQKEATTLETKSRFQKDKFESLRRELQESEKQVFEVCKGRTFDRECEDLHQAIEKLQRNKGQYSSAKIMYEKFVKDFESEKPCCPICLTGFSNKQEAVAEIVRTIKNKIQGIPQHLQKIEEELKLKQEQYSNLLQLKPINDKIEELNTTVIPQVMTENKDLETFHKRVSSELDELTQQLVEPQAILDDCNKVISDAALIDQHQSEIIRAQRKIVDLESQLSQVPSNRSLQQAEAEIEDTRMDNNNARRNCETSQKKLQQHVNRCQELREDRSKYIEKQLQLEKTSQGKPQLQEQMKQLNDEEDKLEVEIGELKLQLAPLTAELKEAERAKENLRNSNRIKINKAQDELNRNQKLLDDINKLQKNVENYNARGGDQTYEAAVNELNELKENFKSLEESKKKIANDLTEINKQMANQDGARRVLEDNSELRKKRKQEHKLSDEIAEIKRKIGDHNYRTILEEKHRLRLDEETLRREISEAIGRHDALQQEINQLTSELNSAENRQAHTNYKKAFIQHTVAKQGVENLQLYLKALEFGVLTFHQERMNQINKIIRQLWRSIYKGNDCDYIEIKTEETKMSGARRTYNYKVVQKKSDVEIEMRGRCSAGQKVLACLVIRMALAETFSKNCGILALDEPTTNLDRANINSLSEALARIVNARQMERHFQLLVITHDEEFLDALSRVDKVSHFWRVSRNNKGNSIVKKESL